ncbi:GrpE, mitochondrial [Elasticomyces elasticus]|nr:GrpE, mitochondrial [Elasticomyces elasticus]
MLQRRLLKLASASSTSALRPQVSSRVPPSLPFPRPSSSPQLSGIVAPRWYSAQLETTPQQSPAAETSSPQSTATDSAVKEDPIKKELDAKSKEVLELKDKYLRSVAEYRNLQEQTRREVAAARDFAIQRFAKDLIDSVDNLDRALTTVPKDKLVPENQHLVTLHDGLKMTENILMQTLKKHGLERFDPAEANETFNPNHHEATFQTPQPDKQDGTVFFTQSKGFLLNGRVLRAAKVGVVKNS